jgi:hypothetical protein
MEIRGVVHNGVVVLDGELELPEGTVVSIIYPLSPPNVPADLRRKINLPWVPSDRPGSLDLTTERLADLLEDDDVPS